MEHTPLHIDTTPGRNPASHRDLDHITAVLKRAMAVYIGQNIDENLRERMAQTLKTILELVVVDELIDLKLVQTGRDAMAIRPNNLYTAMLLAGYTPHPDNCKTNDYTDANGTHYTLNTSCMLEIQPELSLEYSEAEPAVQLQLPLAADAFVPYGNLDEN